MKPPMREGNAVWQFAEHVVAERYDAWTYYRRQFQNTAGGSAAVDFVAVEQRAAPSAGPRCVLWLIEAKDFVDNPRTDPEPLDREVARKMRDTLAGLLATKVYGQETEQSHAARALSAQKVRVVLHLDQGTGLKRQYDPADVQQSLRKLLKAVDAHPIVMDCETRAQVPWTTSTPDP